MSTRWLIAGLLLLLLVLQYRLWLSPKGVPSLWNMEREIVEQHALNERVDGCNRELRAEVIDLKRGKAALEERARKDLGMILPGEIFVSVVEDEAAVEQFKTEEHGRCEQAIR